jgi:Yip1 domain
MFAHMFYLLFKPLSEWQKISTLTDKEIKKRLLYPIVMAFLPVIAFYIGTTKTGWKVLGDDITRITPESAIPLLVLFYVAIMGAVISIGLMLNWMSATYGARSFAIKGVVLVGYAFTPIFLAGTMGVYPIWWLDILLATAACGYAIRLIYLGIPPMMAVSEDRGFLYASAVFLVALVYMAAVLAATVILWEYVAAPVFTD